MAPIPGMTSRAISSTQRHDSSSCPDLQLRTNGVSGRLSACSRRTPTSRLSASIPSEQANDAADRRPDESAGSRSSSCRVVPPRATATAPYPSARKRASLALCKASEGCPQRVMIPTANPVKKTWLAGVIRRDEYPMIPDHADCAAAGCSTDHAGDESNKSIPTAAAAQRFPVAMLFRISLFLEIRPDANGNDNSAKGNRENCCSAGLPNRGISS